MTFAVNPPIAGVDFTKSYTGGSPGQMPPFTLGMEVLDNAGTTWRFVRHTATKLTGLVYVIGTDFTVGNGLDLTEDNASPISLGVFATQPSGPESGSTYSYSWIQVKGPMSGFVGTGAATDVELFSSSLVGTLFTSGGKLVPGAKLKATVASGGSAASLLGNLFAASYLTLPTDA